MLDHGFVRLVDLLGSDQRIVQAARVSYGEGTRSVREDSALIDYLLRHQHTSPFEMVDFTFHIKAPIFVVRQWVRHRTASMNEVSGRYSVLPEEFYQPAADDLRAQSQLNKQVGEGALPEQAAEQAHDLIVSTQDQSYQVYQALLQLGLARELAREVLPVGLYTEFYWKQNLHNLLHFLKLRLDWHAQSEIRQFAEALAHFVQQAVPLTWSSFEEHRLRGRSLSGSEVQALAQLVDPAAYQLALEQAGLGRSRIREAMEKLFPGRTA